MNFVPFVQDESRQNHFDVPTQNVVDISLGERSVVDPWLFLAANRIVYDEFDEVVLQIFVL